MPITLTLIIVGTAILGLFSQEFIHVFKRIFAIPGVKLFLPLLLVSFIVERYVLWGWKGLTLMQLGLFALKEHLHHLMPFDRGALFVTQVFILVILANTPIWITRYLTRKKPLSKAILWVYWFSAAVWIMSSILLIS